MTGPSPAGVPIEPESLAGGLRLRSATLADVEQIADLSAIHHVPDGNPPDEDVRIFVREMLTRPNAQTSLADTLVIDDPATGAIAAKLVMLAHRWRYDGVPVGRGRVEYVTTAPAYRGRGLMTVLMDRYHAITAARGETVQVIKGIHNYYRQFGYEYALPDAPYRELPRDRLTPVGPGRDLRFRQATSADIPLLLELTRFGNRRWLVSADVTAEDWRHELEEMTDANAWRPIVTIVEEAGGRAIGAAYSLSRLIHDGLSTEWAELAEGVDWERVGPPLLDYLDTVGDGLHDRGRHFAIGAPNVAFSRHYLALGDGHPLMDLLEGRLEPMRTRKALYVRVADLPAFLRTIAPALERRLAASATHGDHTGDLRISLYKGGFRLGFALGHLAEVEPWTDVRTTRNDALFPGLTFLQLLFGHRSLTELEHAFADCRALNDPALELLNVLFPKRPSWVWPFF